VGRTETNHEIRGICVGGRREYHLYLKKKQPDATLVFILRETDTIVGVGSVSEQKSTLNFGGVGHFEDIAVDKSMQGRKLGLWVIQALTGISENAGCYKPSWTAATRTSLSVIYLSFFLIFN